MNVRKNSFERDGLKLTSLEVELHNTTLLLLEGYHAFFMCGALDVDVYGTREVLCGRAIGVKTLEDLYQAKLVNCTLYAQGLGIVPGMTVREAFKKISQEK